MEAFKPRAGLGQSLYRPAWPQCSLLRKRPRLLLPLVCSPVEYFCFTFFGRKTACHCRFAVDPTSCLCFSQLWNATKSNRVGRWLLPGKGATSLEHSGGKRQPYLCSRANACVCFETRTLLPARTTGKHANTHVCTLVNPGEGQSLLSVLYSTQAHSSFSWRGQGENDWRLGPFTMP